MFCRECGTENPKGSKFCKNCGVNFEIEEEKPKVKVETTPIQQKKQNHTSNNNTKKSDDGLCWGCCICLIFIFIIFALFGH